MFELKHLSKQGIPAALARVERYRLLNEPEQAESICLDILATEPDNHTALISMLLAITEQLSGGTMKRISDARALLPRLPSEYERVYYAGIICERQARALLNHNRPGSGFVAYPWFREAMDWYEKAEALRPAGNDDAVLRWNTCARFLNRNPQLALQEERAEPITME